VTSPPVLRPRPAPLEPFALEIPGAASSLAMVPVPGSPDGAIRPFWISRTEVTWEAYDAFVYSLDEEAGAPPLADAVSRPSKPYLPPDRGFGHDGFAAISISHQGATDFCAWLSARSGRGFRLATEAEWEHACRAGSPAPGDISEYAWHAGNAAGVTHAAATRQPNAWGLYDMLGNVWEWCNGADGTPVVKGGSYRDAPDSLSCTSRMTQDPAWNASDPQIPKSRWWLADGPFIGLRIVCEGVPNPGPVK
jgi:formylglycine-generating enzyme required for sulfatase activity